MTIHNYRFRIYNLAIARFLSTDPLTRSYPMLTPYQYASNRPIDGVDLDGLEFLDYSKALIILTAGGTYVKFENANRVIRNRATWMSISYSNYNTETRSYEIGSSYSLKVDEGEQYHLSQIPRGKPTGTTRYTGKSYSEKKGGNSKTNRKRRRGFESEGYKLENGRYVSPRARTGSGGRGLALVDAVNWLLSRGADAMNYTGWRGIEEMANTYGALSYQIVDDAFNGSSSTINPKFDTPAFRADLANYILQGQFVNEYDDQTFNELKLAAETLIVKNGIPLNRERNQQSAKGSK